MVRNSDRDNFGWIIKRYQKVFNDSIGGLKNFEVKLNIDKSVHPVRRIGVYHYS